MIVFLGTVHSSIKEVKAPFMLDGYHGIALPAMQGNGASSRGEGEVSWIFSSCGSTLCIFSSYDGDAHSKRKFV